MNEATMAAERLLMVSRNWIVRFRMVKKKIKREKPGKIFVAVAYEWLEKSLTIRLGNSW